MNVTIRTDSSLQIGTGHLMRCLTLADALRNEGARAGFICRELPGHLCDFIAERGFPVKRLPFEGNKGTVAGGDTAHAHWLGAPWEADAVQTRDALAQISTPIELLIVDHYALDARWESQLRPLAKRIMVIDDLADRPHDCDLLLDQNLYEDMDTRYNGLVPTGCKTLLGPRYALLRPEFREAREHLRERDGCVRRILIFFGGADPTNETAKALEAFKTLDRQDIVADVVVGSANPHISDVEQACATLPNVNFHVQVDNMAQIMVQADLAIGAGGATTWERCCLGLPALVVTVATNQEKTAKHLADSGYQYFLGRSEIIDMKKIQNILQLVLEEPWKLKQMARNCISLVDAGGAQMVVSEIAEGG